MRSHLCMMQRNFDVFISHYTKDDSHDVFMVVRAFLDAKDKTVFNPTTHLSHVKIINKEAMQGAVRRSKLVIAALSDGFFESTWCEAEIVAAKEAGIPVIPVYSGDHHGAKMVDKWVDKYKAHESFGYVFHENARDVLNKQNPDSTKKTLAYMATLIAKEAVAGAPLLSAAEKAAEEPQSDVPAWKLELQKKKAAKAAAPKEPEAAVALLSGWQQRLDETSGRPYYCNTQTGVSQWEVPTEPVQPRQAGNAVDELPQGWLAMHDADGRKYFANTVTGKTQWEQPMHDK